MCLWQVSGKEAGLAEVLLECLSDEVAQQEKEGGVG